MLFNSYIFVLFFLPMAVLGYYLLNSLKRYQLGEIFLLGMSLWFYAYFNVKYLFIFALSIIVNYGIYILLKRILADNSRKILLTIGLLFNFGFLFYYKYYDFFIKNINEVFKTDFTLLHLILPLGISFFTFQQISFIIDAYKNQVPNYDFITYALFVSFFPQLIAGPIITHDEIVPQLLQKDKKKPCWNSIAQGIYIFTIGLSKKVLLADKFGSAVNWGFENYLLLDTTNSIIVILSYTLQIYFDFSGYSDMAIGIAKMFQIDLPINFNSPYKSFTIIEFWNRWHITLTRFFTKYIYIPLGGNRNGVIRTYINIMIIYFFSGMWHGANWTFIVWGFAHGFFSVITRCLEKIFKELHPALNWIITFTFINITWVIFRADSIHQALVIMKRVCLMNFATINESLAAAFNGDIILLIHYIFPGEHIFLTYKYIIMMFYFTVSLIIILGLKNSYEKMNHFKLSLRESAATIILLMCCILSFSGVSTFLYFNF